MNFGAHIAVDLVPARVPHGAQFVDLAPILAFSDGRMVMGELTNVPWLDKVQPGIADLSHCDLTGFDDGDREDAGHSPQFLVFLGEPENLVVGDCYCFPNAIGRRSSRAFQAGSEQFVCSVGGFFAGSLAANTVDNEENPKLRVGMEAIFIVFALSAGIG